MPTCYELYEELYAQGHEVLKRTFAEDTDNLHSQSHNFLMDFSNWFSVLDSRPEVPLFHSALKEYQYGLINISQGLYRQAYTALRSFIEQSLAAIHFSANELELRLWMNGQQDIYWKNIIDEDKGIFSKKFVEGFAPPLLDNAKLHRELARILYRECSEFTHGNFKTYVKLPQLLEYNKEIFIDWHDKAETARIIVTFALCVRYLWFIDDGKMKEALESSIMEYLGHLFPVRSFYDTSREEV